jgi:acyl-CoA synthetase (AMP-forming)/AMP-acid ligase II
MARAPSAGVPWTAGPTTWLGGSSAPASAIRTTLAIYLYNCSEYLEVTFACFKIGLVPINTNYRYADDELVYLWENADTTWRWSSTAPSWSGSKGSATGCPG